MAEEDNFWKAFNEHYQFSLRELEKARDRLLLVSLIIILLTVGGMHLDKIDVGGISLNQLNAGIIVLVLVLIDLGLLLEFFGQCFRAFLVSAGLDSSPFAVGIMQLVKAKLGDKGFIAINKFASKAGAASAVVNFVVPALTALLAIFGGLVFGLRSFVSPPM